MYTVPARSGVAAAAFSEIRRRSVHGTMAMVVLAAVPTELRTFSTTDPEAIRWPILASDLDFAHALCCNAI